MIQLLFIACKGILRDRVLYGIAVLCLLFALVPFVSVLSMRQVAELSLTLSLSLISFMLLLCSLVLSTFAIWRDIERRYTFSVLSLPFSRSQYVLSKFFAVAVFLVLAGGLLGLLGSLAVMSVAAQYPPDIPLVWSNFFIAVSFSILKYILLCAFGILFSSVSTSFFLPIFGTIAVFLAGNISQDVHNYLQSSAATDVPGFVKILADIFYYLLPNFEAFNFNLTAIYGLPVDIQSLLLTGGYFLLYIALILTFSCMIFQRRELR